MVNGVSQGIYGAQWSIIGARNELLRQLMNPALENMGRMEDGTLLYHLSKVLGSESKRGRKEELADFPPEAVHQNHEII